MAKRLIKTVKNSAGNKVALRTGESLRKDGMLIYRYTTEDGERKTITASTIEKLREKEKEIVEDGVRGVRADTKNVTLDAAFKEWRELKRSITDNTMANYVWLYDQFIKSRFGRQKLSSITNGDIRKFYNSLYDDRGLSMSTISNVHIVINHILVYAVEQRYIDRNPAVNTLKDLSRAHSDEGEKHKALTIPEQKRFIEFLRSSSTYKRWYPIFAVMLGTGLRVGEAAGLRWVDVDIEKGIVDANHAIKFYKEIGSNKTKFTAGAPKTKAGVRTIPMVDYVREAFIEQKAYLEKTGVKCNVVINGYTDFIFLNRNGAPYHQAGLNSTLKRIIRDANYEAIDRGDGTPLLPYFTCHSLRTTFCTRLIEAGVNIRVVMELMGHKSIQTTMDIYTTVNPDWMSQQVEQFESYLNALNIGEEMVTLPNTLPN